MDMYLKMKNVRELPRKVMELLPQYLTRALMLDRHQR
jgi:hypothetical protein